MKLRGKMHMSRGRKVMPQPALVHTCPSCKLVFRVGEKEISPVCPGCGEEHTYSARSVFGKQAYRYEKTQQPWKTEQIRVFSRDLTAMVNNFNG